MSKFVWIYQMSLKRKEYQQQQQIQATQTTVPSSGLRVAAGEPHLVSLGGGRLSTAVTIHHLPRGDLTIGSSPSCGVILNGSGVLPVHCTLYRDDNDGVLLVPEPEGRTLVDGNRVIDELNLRQGAMLTIGKANYLRFNNPAEAELIKSTIGSSERISMPQIDFTSNDSSPCEDDENKNILNNNSNSTTTTSNGTGNNNKFLESTTVTTAASQGGGGVVVKSATTSEILDKFTRNDFVAVNLKNNFHSPKVFTADTVTVNAAAKDVLGPKYNNFAKNLNNSNNIQNNNLINNNPGNYVNLMTGDKVMGNKMNGNGVILGQQNDTNSNILTTFNNLNGSNGTMKVQNSSYDRYPKTRGGLQVFPMNGVNEQMNNNGVHNLSNGTFHLEAQRQKAQSDRLKEQEMSRAEQDRLEEILQLCAEYERQNSNSSANSNITSSPIVQNRIKTNGSLPRDKKSPFCSELNSPFNDKSAQVFFPSDEKFPKKPISSGYENVSLNSKSNRVEIASSRYENVGEIVGENGDPMSPKKTNYVPQSPRTKIRTTCSPQLKQKSVEIERKAEYDLLLQSFEERQRIENLKNNSLKYSDAEKRILDSIRHSNDSKTLSAMKQERNVVLAKVRELKTQIADLQRQEDEVLRELDIEKALVFGELVTEKENLFQMETELTNLQQQIHRMEAQRNANRVMQETQQAKLRQKIEVKEDQVQSLEKLIEGDHNDKSLREELDETISSMENDKKVFEDLEFQYLEEETDWLSRREDLHSDLKLLTVALEEKQTQILRLENQKVTNQDIACTDTKRLEKSLFNLLKDLEKSREELKLIDNKIVSMSNGKSNEISDSDEDIDFGNLSLNEKDKVMSNSLFGSQEVLKQKPSESIMSKSVNENMFFNNLEIPDFSSTPKKATNRVVVDISQDINQMITKNQDKLKTADDHNFVFKRHNENVDDPLLKLKYNLSPPFDRQQHNLQQQDSIVSDGGQNDSKINLNLSLEGDDFEVNPLIERVPSQDDIDRISKVTSNAPISTQGASYKVKESIREIERNRQLLLAQQGCHVIEHERQKMNELKKKSHDEARAQYLRLQSSSRSDSESSQKNEPILEGEPGVSADDKSPDKTNNEQRHSHPDFDAQQQYLLRPLSEVNSEISYDGGQGNEDRTSGGEKQFKSTNDIYSSAQNTTVQEIYRSSGGLPTINNVTHRNHRNNYLQDGGEDSHRNSGISTQSAGSQEESGTMSKLVSGSKRNLPKVQRPLTRYLPIMSADLDLKQHIESAGHQINLCPHVIVDSYSCRGYLHKLGATFHGWSRRWFVLDRQKGALIYYSDKSERKPRGGSYFTTIDEVYLDHLNTSKSGRPHCTFIVKTKKRSYHLQAASDAAARIWIDAIITGAQGNMDYL